MPDTLPEVSEVLMSPSHGADVRRMERERQPSLLHGGGQRQPRVSLVQTEGRVQPAGDDPPSLHRGHLK